MAKFKFNFRVKFLFNATASELNDWKAAFSRASQVLFHATDSQLQFNKITVERYGGSQSSAHVSIYECCGRSVANTAKVSICRDERTKPLVILHELSHHFFDLGDEYISMASNGCTKSPSSQACIMEFSSHGDRMKGGEVESLGMVNQYCRPSNHTETNPQHETHHQSCIETIKSYMDVQHQIDFDLPTSSLGAMTVDNPSGHDPVTWEIVEDGSKHVVVIDNSVGLINGVLADAQRIGTRFWVDNLADESDQLGIVAGNGELVFPLRNINDENTRQEAFEAINKLQFQSQLNPVAAINLASNEIRKSKNDRTPTPEVTHQSITFVATQDLTGVFAPKQQIDSGNRISLIDIGSRVNRFGLGRISESTGGIYHNIGQAEFPATAFEVQNRLIELSLNAIQENGLVLHKTTFAPALKEPPERLEDDPKKSEAQAGLPTQVKETILVESGCTEATFVVSKKESVELDLEIANPTGQAIDLNSNNSIDRGEYSLIKVKKPIAGQWTIKVKRSSPGKAIKVKILASLKNPDLSVRTKILPLADGSGVKISAQANFQKPLVNIEEPIVEIYQNSPNSEPGEFITKTTLAKYQIAGPNYVHIPHGYESLYSRNIRLAPGVYNLVVRFANTGTAQNVDTCEDCDCPECPSSDKPKTKAPVSPFVRIQKRQIILHPTDSD